MIKHKCRNSEETFYLWKRESQRVIDEIGESAESLSEIMKNFLEFGKEFIFSLVKMLKENEFNGIYLYSNDKKPSCNQDRVVCGIKDAATIKKEKWKESNVSIRNNFQIKEK